MANIPASTNRESFQRYDFDFEPSVSLLAGFLRLIENRKWQKGSKSKFESIWNECFGSNVSADHHVNENAIEAASTVYPLLNHNQPYLFDF